MERVQRWHGGQRASHGCTAAKIRNLSHKKLGAHLDLTPSVLPEGDWQNRISVDSSNGTSDSNSCSGDDSFMFDLSSSSKQACGTQIKNPLMEEPSKDKESKQRPPSVIARLMGLDALPPQQPVHKQPKIFSQKYLQKTASIENKPSYECRPLRKKKSKAQIEFKDVFEVLETSKAEKVSHQSVPEGLENAKPRNTRMAFVEQNFIDAKRLSTDEKLRQSKEFHDALKVSDKDLLQKFLQGPDSLFTKHLSDLHEASPPCQFSNITVLKSSNAPKNAHTDMCWTADSKIDGWEARNSLQKEFCHGQSRDGAYNPTKIIKSQSEENDKDRSLPTRIIVLKPNAEKAQSTSASASSNSSVGFQSRCRINGKSQSSEIHQLFAEVWNRKDSSNNMRCRPKSSREIAKEMIRQRSEGANNCSVRLSSLGLRGYAGDDKSHNVSAKDSKNKLDDVPPASRHPLDPKNKYSPSSSCSIESSVGMEAKKRLSDRWKMTSQSQEVGLVGKSSSRSTLGEMLAMPDREIQPLTSGSGEALGRNDGTARWGSPSGISSRDGWKDDYSRDHRRSKSVPALSFVFGSSKSGTGLRVLGTDSCAMSKAINEGSHRSRIRRSNHTEDSLLRDLRSKNEKSFSSFRANRENNCAERETPLSLDKLKDNLVKTDHADLKPVICEPLSHVADQRLIVEEVQVPETQDMNWSSETIEEQLPESTACIMLDTVGDFPNQGANGSILKEAPDQSTEEGLFSANCSLPEPESPGSIKDVDQPSPISVLEPFAEDVSSGPESFGMVSADLNGLRMQLRLLKSETSIPCGDEFAMNVSSDEETREESVNHSEEKGKYSDILRIEENRDYFYVNDVLVFSGLNRVNRERILSAFQSLEIPIGLEAFEKLEKKYGEQLRWPRSERRLLFDRLNHGLMEIFQPCMDPYPWVMPTRRRLAPWREEYLVEELWKLLVNQIEKGSNKALEKDLLIEMSWLELGDEIDMVSKGIEKLILDELIEEVISM